MSGPLIFIPGARGIPSRSVERLPLPLRGMLADASWGSPDRTTGPENQAGQLLVVEPSPGSGGQAADPPGYRPDEQTWLKLPAEPQAEGEPEFVWIGWYKQRPPGPKDLVRDETIDGHRVKLGDGRDWLVPVIHAPVTNLPQSFFPAADGMILRPVIRYRALMERTAAFVDQIEAAVAKKADWPSNTECFDFVAQVLRVNYRLHDRMLDGAGLDLVRTDHLVPIFKAATGLTAAEEERAAQKKSVIRAAG